MSDHIIIYTDGASRGNPGPGGWASVILIPEDKRVIEIGDREEKTTNNRMELQGIIGALLAIRKFPGDIVIHTDSSYVIQGITKWVDGWIRNGWITSTKEQVLNRDLWEILTSLLYEREENYKVNWKHVSGHMGIPGNERCDEIATTFADGKEPELYDGPVGEYPHDLMSTISNRVKKEIRDEKKTRSKGPAYSYVSMIDGDIKTHQSWEECEARVKGVSNAKFKKAFSEKDEHNIIAEWKETANA